MKVKIPYRNKLTTPMKKEVHKEAMRQLGEKIPEFIHDIETVILWQLHVQYGFGHDRLMKFYNSTTEMIESMLEYYCYDTDEEATWICEQKLKEECGIDIQKLKGAFQYRPIMK